MANEKKVCSICEREYDFCYTCEESYSKVMLAWRTVVCSPNCFKQYMINVENNERLALSENINKDNKEIERSRNMQVLLQDEKTYMVDRVENVKIYLQGVEEPIKVGAIKEVIFANKEDIVALADIIKKSKIVEKTEKEVEDIVKN